MRDEVLRKTMVRNNRKGELEFSSLVDIILILVISGITLSAGLYAMTLTRDSITTTQVIGIYNETHSNVKTATETAFTTLTYGSINTIYAVTNSTSGAVVPANNYSYVAATGRFYVIGPTWNNTDLNVSYGYNSITNNVVITSTNATIAAIGNISGWYAIIIAVALIGIVISVLMMVRRPEER